MSTSTVHKVYFKLYGTFIEVLPCYNEADDPVMDCVEWLHITGDKISFLDGMFIDDLELDWLPDYSPEQMFQISVTFDYMCVYLLRTIQEYFGNMLKNGIGFTSEHEYQTVELTVQY